jgi:eukaryotic-like serine/threonine-protein kinase
MSAVSGEAPRSGRLPVLAKYDVIEELGHGGMATVYRAHDKRLGRDVAVKVIHPHLRDSGEVARRFSIEAQAVAKLRHPNIVEVYDVSSEGEVEQYLVVELLRGKTLRKMLQAVGSMPPEVAAQIGVELLDGLGHAHGQGVVHRDVKPENVIIEHGGEGSGPRAGQTPVPTTPPTGLPKPKRESGAGDRAIVKLTDFGIAKLLDAQGMTSTGQVLGSPAHMAPEQIEGQDVDGRADVFGIGVLLYECMVGHLPFEGNNPAQVLRRVLDGIYPSAERERPTVGRVFSRILDKALGRKPEDRFESAEAMREALTAELSRLGVTNPRGELAAYWGDPSGYAERHEKKTIALLCELALAARKRGDAMAAAADYNRALAYAPHDPALLRIVASLHGAEARRRFLWRAAPLTAGTLLLGVLAFGVTRQLRARHAELAPDAPPSHEAPIDPLVVAPTVKSEGTPEPSAEPSSNRVASVPPGARTASSANAAPVKTGAHEVKFSAVWPSNIVQVSVDGEHAVGALAAGSTLPVPVDDKSHEIRFSCEPDYCVPKSTVIEAGKSPVSPMAVKLDFRPATLTITGNDNSTYAFEDDPATKLPRGQNIVSMKNVYLDVTVIEYPSGRRMHRKLTAGKKETVDFTEGAP